MVLLCNFIWGHISRCSLCSVHSLNDGLLSVRLQLGNVDARGVGEGAAEAQNRLEALFSVDRDIHSGSEGNELYKFQRCRLNLTLLYLCSPPPKEVAPN